ncbi:hypothetical protein AB1Y20_016606 [Prymnesium parvum]|uniref:Protein-tyrosine sulfotransferase n=1 Tax=Prymnesium parvum TaxID=97485 RepID=A0AB34ID39_PRYPA
MDQPGGSVAPALLRPARLGLRMGNGWPPPRPPLEACDGRARAAPAGGPLRPSLAPPRASRRRDASRPAVGGQLPPLAAAGGELLRWMRRAKAWRAGDASPTTTAWRESRRAWRDAPRPPRRRAALLLLLLRAGDASLPEWAHRRLEAKDAHGYIFMGGLQRSGTTWLEGLVASPLVSGLSFDNVAPREYEARAPWLLQNHTRAHFEMVARFGGVEGKFVQDVYRYVYLVRDVGREGRNLSSLFPAASDASADAAARLFGEWSLFWDTSRPLLLEKTPENLLMAPYLQAAFAPRVAFVFVMRHPLVWSLAIEKWVGADFLALRTVEARVAFWFDCMAAAAAQLPSLRDATLVQLEVLSASPQLQLALARHLLCAAAAGGGARRPAAIRAADEIGASSRAYVRCWLAGLEFKTSLKRCAPRRAAADASADENRWRLAQLRAEEEGRALRFGYSFARLAEAEGGEAGGGGEGGGEGGEEEEAYGVRVEPLLVPPAVRARLAAPPRRAPPPPPRAAAAGAPRGVLLAYHKLGFDAEKPTGMDIRMGQVVSSLVALGAAVHFVCHCTVDPTQLSPFPRGVSIYAGTLRQQFDAAMARGAPSHAFLFFTTLTMFVHQRLLQGDAAWHVEPLAPLPEERLLSWLPAGVCAVALTDDIHFLRSVEVMRRYDLSKALAAAVWVRARELAFYAAAATVVTVSEEDAAALARCFDASAAGAACAACVCALVWLPYVVDASPAASLPPFSRRRDGILYVGGSHGLALAAIEWLLGEVQPAIAAARGAGALLAGGVGHLHLAGPGWAAHLAAPSRLNASVGAGRVTLLGVLSDAALEAALHAHKVFAAPVINGTGIATKNVLAMARGIPLVTTPVGLHGLGLPATQRAVLVADDAAAFARQLVWVQSSEEAFAATAAAALAHAAALLSPRRQREVLCSLLHCDAAALAPPPQAEEEARLGCPAGGAAPPVETVEARHAAAEARRAGAPAGSAPLVLLGLWGAPLRELAARLGGVGCLVEAPLRAVARAPAEEQAEHLEAILAQPDACRALTQRRGGAAPLFHGFSLELGAPDASPALLSTPAGLSSLASLLSRLSPRLLLVRRCDFAAWARLLLPPPHDAPRLAAAAAAAAARDAALLLLARATAAPLLAADGTPPSPPRLAAFLSLRARALPAAPPPPPHAPPPAACAPPPANASLAAALAALAAPRAAPAPARVVAVHSAAGGAAPLAAALREACRAYLTPRRGLACAFLDAAPPCGAHPADLCLSSAARFSAARAARRGFRLAHVVRDPLEWLARSFLAAPPTAALLPNATALLAAFEAHVKARAAAELREAQALGESYAADPRYLRVRFEDLADGATRNATLAGMLGFLLDEPLPSDALPASVWAALAKALKADEQGGSQRKHLVGLIKRRPLKCHHLTKMQTALGYPPLACAAS